MAKKTPKLIYSQSFSGTISIGANLGYIFVFKSLSDHLTAVIGDGYGMKDLSIQVHFRTFMANKPPHYTMRPVFVQVSNGQIASNLNTVQREVLAMLDLACSDEYGYRPGKAHVSKYLTFGYIPSDDDQIVMAKSDFTVTVPPEIISILSKDQNSEKSQDVYLVLLGDTITAVTPVISWVATIDVAYSPTGKSIILR